MRAIDGFTGTFVVACALKLAPLWFCRPGEIRQAEWVNFDLDGEQPTYTVPPIIRKLRKAEKENPQTLPHIVPLSTQAIAILRELHQLTGRGRYLFPGARSTSRNMSDGAVNAALARIGYKGIITDMASAIWLERCWGSSDGIPRRWSASCRITNQVCPGSTRPSTYLNAGKSCKSGRLLGHAEGARRLSPRRSGTVRHGAAALCKSCIALATHKASP